MVSSEESSLGIACPNRMEQSQRSPAHCILSSVPKAVPSCPEEEDMVKLSKTQNRHKMHILIRTGLTHYLINSKDLDWGKGILG